jgi:acetyl-CoA carboxylase carboxyl transferase subunit beta
LDADFIAGSVGSVVGEKRTPLIEYATNPFLPLIRLCASGGERTREGNDLYKEMKESGVINEQNIA